jgi:hypothetical protein
MVESIFEALTQLTKMLVLIFTEEFVTSIERLLRVVCIEFLIDSPMELIYCFPEF